MIGQSIRVETSASSLPGALKALQTPFATLTAFNLHSSKPVVVVSDQRCADQKVTNDVQTKNMDAH